MSGRAPLENLPPFKNAAHIFAFKNGAWEPAREPVAEDPEAALGPSMAFADALYDVRRRDVGLVNCALGATSIKQWQPSSDANSLFGACVARARAAAGGAIAGLLWYQGEWDAFSREGAEAWPALFVTAMKGFRQSFGAPALPVVFTQIGPRGTPGDPLDRLMELQGKIRLANAAMVTATDLTFQSDHLHLDQVAQLALGKRYAAAMASLLSRR